MLRQIKFRVRVEVTLKTRGGIFSGIDNQFPSAARFDMFAAGAVTRFATGSTCQFRAIEMDASVNAPGESLELRRVTISANFVADKSRVGNFRRSHDRAGESGTRAEKKTKADK